MVVVVVCVCVCVWGGCSLSIYINLCMFCCPRELGRLGGGVRERCWFLRVMRVIIELTRVIICCTIINSSFVLSSGSYHRCSSSALLSGFHVSTLTGYLHKVVFVFFVFFCFCLFFFFNFEIVGVFMMFARASVRVTFRGVELVSSGFGGVVGFVHYT